ncbi:hypothetical protein KR222_009538, partial [Zaprionus bogoriensis]
MGLMASHQLGGAELAAYQEATGLSLEQLEQLHQRFRALDRCQRGYLTPTELLRIPQLAQNPLHRQIIDGFFADATSTDRIGFDQFARTCATFLVPQFGLVAQQRRADGRDQKLRLLSRMFDTQRCGRIERSDFRRAMASLLSNATASATAAAAATPPSEGVAANACKEEELQLLEQQAFGTQPSLSYEQFEQRFAGVDVQARLAVSKWLHQQDWLELEADGQAEAQP